MDAYQACARDAVGREWLARDKATVSWPPGSLFIWHVSNGAA